jgi:hypothetical protein
MQNQIDITKIEDLKELKSLCFDQLAILEQTKSNLTLLNQQIINVQKKQSEVVAETKPE